MTTLTPGANAPVTGSSLIVTLRHGAIAGADMDVSAFLLTAAGKVRTDEDMCFYGQPDVAGGAVRLKGAEGGVTRFAVDLGQLPEDVEKVVFAATIHEQKATFAAQPEGEIRLEIDGEASGAIPCSGMTETALILGELYRRQGAWKIRIVGQGFNGGLAALAPHFGVVVGDEPAAAPAPTAAPRVDLAKRLVDLEKKDPQLVSLVKKVQVSLEKKGITRDRAKVMLCLDISGSMSALYSSGKIDQLVQRVMALGYRFDDDGEIDVVLFGARVHSWGTVGVDDYRSFVRDMRDRHSLEGGTRYGDAMERIREIAAADNPEGLPVFVMFVTDGGTDDKPKTRKQLKAASDEPLFWKFMAIGAKGRFAQARFDFLESLDDMTDRTVDNADFFQLTDPSEPSDEEIFDLLMEEYPDWQREAAAKGILKS